MTTDNLLKAVSCNVKADVLPKIIASLMQKEKDLKNCFRQLILCFSYLSYDVNGFDIAMRTIARVWEEKKDVITNADYLSKLLFACRSDATMACKKLAIAGNGDLANCEPAEINDELTSIDDAMIVDMLSDLLSKIDDEDSSSKEGALRRAIDVDLSNKNYRNTFKTVFENSRMPQHKVLVEDCFYLMDEFPELINDILFVLCHTICYPKQDKLKRASIEKIEGVLFKGAMTLSCGWSPPKSLIKFRNTCVYFENANIPKISSEDENMKKTFENMKKTAELCQDLNSEDQMADFENQQKKQPKKPAAKASKPDSTKSMNDIYNEVWHKLSEEERQLFKNCLAFKKAMKELPGGYPTESSKYSELTQHFSSAETVAKSTSSASDSKKKPTKTDSITEISADNVGDLIAEFTHGTSPYAYIEVDDEPYIGKMSASPPNEKYHDFFNWVKTLFGIQSNQHVLFKCAEKHCVVKAIDKKHKKTIGLAENKSEDSEKKTFSIWQCYNVSDGEPYLLGMEDFEKSSDELKKNAFKFAVVRWLFGFAGTTLNNLFILPGSVVTGFWDNAPSDRSESGCFSGLLKNEKMVQIATDLALEVVEEVADTLKQNIESIYNYFPEEKDQKKIRTLLETKIRPSMINTDDKRSYKELIMDEIEKELAAASQKIKDDKAKKAAKAK